MLISWLLVFVPVTTGLLLDVFAFDRSCDPSACRMDPLGHGAAGGALGRWWVNATFGMQPS